MPTRRSLGGPRDGDARLLDLRSPRARFLSREDGQASFAVVAVLLLVLFTYSFALMGPSGPWSSEGTMDRPSLREAESSLREAIRGVMDDSLERAIEIAAIEDGVDLSSALDAIFASQLPTRIPLTAGGFSIGLDRAWAGLRATGREPSSRGVPAGGWGPFARVEVALSCPAFEDIGPIRLSLEVLGQMTSPNAIVAEAGSLIHALSDDEGPVAFTVQNDLWELALGRTLQGERDPEGIIGLEDVERALVRSITGEVAGGIPSSSGPHVIELEMLVRRSVEGMLERNLGWVDDYLFNGNGLEGLLAIDADLAPVLPFLAILDGWKALEAELRDMASEAVTASTMAALERVGAGDLDLGPGEDIRTLTIEAIATLDRLALRLGAELARGGMARTGGTIAQRTVEWLLGAPEGALDAAIHGLLGDLVDAASEGPLARYVDRVLSDVTRVVATLGLDCARDSLLAMGMNGPMVDQGYRDSLGEFQDARGSLEVEIEELRITTIWSGQVACEPGNMLRTVLGPFIEAREVIRTALGAMAFTSTCRATVQGTARVIGAPSGSFGGRTGGVEWRVPVEMTLEVPVVTGWSLHDVRYRPSSTLSEDLARLSEAVYGAIGSSIGYLTHGFMEATEWVVAQLEDLYGDMRESLLSKSAYTLSQALWRIGESLVDRNLGKAINGSWDLLMDLFGDVLRERLTWELELMGTRLNVSLDPELQQIRVGLVKGKVSLSVSVRRLCDPHPPFSPQPIQGYYWGVFGEARLDLGEKGASLHLDPLTLEHPSVMTLVATWGDELNGSGRELKVEALEARKARGTSGITLSQMTGGLHLLSLGGGALLDAGVVVHGDLVDEDALRELVTKALKAAWLATVRGWKVGDLLGNTGRGPDAVIFVETLLRELYFALLERAADLVEEIEAFLEVDPPGPGWPSVRVSLVLSRPLEVLLPLEQWVGRGLRALIGTASSGTSGAYGNAALGLSSWLAGQVLVRTELLWAVEPPTWMGPLGGLDMPDEVGLVLRCQANLASLAALAGRGGGGWESQLEVLLRGVPGAALALVPGMGSPEWKWAEVTLLRVALREAATPRVLLSQVLYDVRGRDSDLEFVEVVNAWDRVVDLEGFVLEDNGGRYKVRGHHPLLPGDHLLVVRNGTAAHREWGLVPDADRMGLRLSNEGDRLTLLAPDGTVLDLVAWEGYRSGWAGVGASEGSALRRLEGNLDRCEPSAWTVEMPAPRRSGR